MSNRLCSRHNGNSYGIDGHIFESLNIFRDMWVSLHILEEGWGKKTRKDNKLSSLRRLNTVYTFLDGKTHRNYVFDIVRVSYKLECKDGLVRLRLEDSKASHINACRN